MTIQLLAALLGGSASLGVAASESAPAVEHASLRAQLQELAQRTVVFGHQSVGGNVLEGLRELAAGEGVTLRLVEIAGPGEVASRTFAHTFLAENGKPSLKLENFERALAARPDVDLALMKFCYVDFDARTDVRALFAEYQRTLARLRQAHPRTVFVHVTVPLTTIQSGAKGLVKRALGKMPNGVVENSRRDEFNRLLREAAGSREPLFDLAAVESTAPDGRHEAFVWEGRSIPALVPAYTDDGGHLNRQARELAARQLVAVLASARAAAR